MTMGLLRTLLYCFPQSSLIPILKPSNFGFVILGKFSSSKCPRPAVVLNPILPELWNDVITWVGAIMARTDFRLSKVTKRPPSTQNLFPNKYFDLWLCIDTQNSHLCSTFAAKASQMTKVKNENFQAKKESNFQILSYRRVIHLKKKAENMYNTDSA